jgi:hypothetical protein
MKTFTIDSDNNITVFASKKQAIASTTPFDPFASQEELSELAAEWPMNRLVEIWNSIPGVAAISKFTSRKIAIDRIWKAIQNLDPTPKQEEVADVVLEPSSAVEPEAFPELAPITQEPAPEVSPEVLAVAEAVSFEPTQETTPEPATAQLPAESDTDTSLSARSADLAPEEPGTSKKARKQRPAKQNKATSDSQPTGPREGSKTSTILALIQRPEGATLAELMNAAAWQAHSVRGFISGTLGKKMGLKVASAKRQDGVRVYTLAE